MAGVAFNVTKFRARYPEFASVADATLTAIFTDETPFYLDNSDASPYAPDRRLVLLNMLVAHIAYIGGALNADGMPKPVGRVSSATEGSVSANFEGVTPTPGSGAWFQQSQYGAAFWQATTAHRSFFHCPDVSLY